MDEWVSDLSSSLSTVFNQNDVIEQVVEVLKNIGVTSEEDLQYVEEGDLAGVLKPVEIRKALAVIKRSKSVVRKEYDSSSLTSSQIEESSTGEDSFFSEIDDSISSDHSTLEALPTGRSAPVIAKSSSRLVSNQASPTVSSQASPTVSSQASPTVSSRASPTVSSRASPIASESRYSPPDSDWHYSFVIPWSKIPSGSKNALDNEKRLSAAERREVVRIVVAEILTVCMKPGKKHISEIARRMVIRYPKSFRDEIDGQVVGTGYDSLVKQFGSRIDNIRRLQAPPTQKRLSDSSSPSCSKKQRKDAYGCINPDPELPNSETKQLQKQKQEELAKMFRNKDKDANKIARLMVETYPSQRRDMLSGLKETKEISKEWPFLFEEIGMRIHFRELTGVQIDDSFEDSTATKFRRILRYFQFVHTEASSRAGTILNQTLAGADETSAAVLLLLAHFKEQQDKMFINVDDTAVSADVDTTILPSTPCIVVCGNNPLNAQMFMVAVDQVIVNEHLPSFNKAFQMMFCSYYLHNIDYPVELAATLEFVQRCIFKINPDQGTKVVRKEKRRQYAVNPRVLSLISKIANFEWTE